MKVVVATMYSPSHQELADLTVPNMKEYAQKHNYDTHEIKIENDKWEYKKHEEFKELFKQGYDLIWYKDVDSIITNMTIPITDFIDEDNSFYLTLDFTELNGGSVIIKNTDYGNRFNEDALSQRTWYQNEQNFYNSITRRCLLKVLPHPSINSYNYSLYPECKEYVGREDLGDWQEGNLLLHVPALQMKDRIETLKNAKIIYE